MATSAWRSPAQRHRIDANMKILFVYPYCLEDRIDSEDVKAVPIGLYYVAAMLKENGYDTEIMNWHDLRRTPDSISAVLMDKKPDVIGFSVLHANRWGAIEIARIAKGLNPQVKIVFGGVGATTLWHHLLTHFKEIDYVILGEGETGFFHLIQAIEKGDGVEPEAIHGIAYRKQGGPVKTAEAEAVRDLDRLPDPSRFFTFQHVSSTRGCPKNCTFCGSPRFWGKAVRFHSPAYFVRQLERLARKGVSFFYFSDDTFTIDSRRTIDICNKIIEKKLGITWAAISHVDYINEDILPWMRKAGCIQISFGVESGSEKIRKLFGKPIKTERLIEAFTLTRAYGIMPRAYFIYGSPGETLKTIEQSIDLMDQIKPLGAIFYILDVFPGTALYQDFKKRNHATDDIWLERIEDIMYFQTDPHLSQDQILDFGRRLRAGFYEKLPKFVEQIDLVDREDFRGLHADFLSRLAMTFSHGDYAAIAAIKGKEVIAESLYRRSLGYFPNRRAYLGLGMIYQMRRDFEKSTAILAEGLNRFPDSDLLTVCQGINWMNRGDYRTALSFFNKFPFSPGAAGYIDECHRLLGK